MSSKLILKKYAEMKLLGEGTYGKAFLVKNIEDGVKKL